MIVLAFSGGCGLLAPRESLEFAVTNKHSASPAIVTFLIRNRLDAPVSVLRCGDRVSVDVERFSAHEWTNAGAAICQTDRDMSPLMLAPGESVVDSVSVHQPGSYRLRTRVGLGMASNDILTPSFGIP
jgi:hypothetical protein